MNKKLKVALAGNPNCGKTTVFNNLTGARQHVGNYPGVTVEKKEGRCRHNGVELQIVDLPGTYSLTAYSIEEMVARSFITDEKPDVVVNIVDASNLERNLYLTTQLIELGVPLVLVFNMSDMAKAQGFMFDIERLSELLGCPIVSTVGHRNKGTDDLLEAVVAISERQGRETPTVRYGREIEEEIVRVHEVIERDAEALTQQYPARWLALKLLEKDEDVRAKITSDDILAVVDKSIAHLENIFGGQIEFVIAERRYGFISGVYQETVKSTVETRHNMSDRIDAVVTNRYLGLPIFLILMYLTFNLTFTLGEPMMGLIEGFIAHLAEAISGLWPAGSESPLRSLLVDGVIGGVGGVIVFLPNILFLFLAIAFLEDTGYMARAAFIMDELMHKIGLHGKSFIPMLIGFGCSVPAIMATRVLENRRDRLTTIMVIPLMSCGARLLIYLLIIPAFFVNRVILDLWVLKVTTHAALLWMIYVVGIVLAIGAAKVLKLTLFKGEALPFVMELPPYRLPTVKGLMIHMWERCWMYVKKAGTVILVASIILWAVTSYPKKTLFDRDYAAQRAQAQATCLAQVAELNDDLGLPADSTLLVKAASDEFTEVPDQINPAPSDPVVMKFFEIRDAIVNARTSFQNAVDESALDQTSPQYAILRYKLDAELTAIAKDQSRIYDAAIKYIDTIHSPYDEAILQLLRSRQAEELSYTIAGRIGRGFEPVLKPMGFDWRIGTAMIGAFAAKEIFVSQLGIVFSLGDVDEGSDALRQRLRDNYTPLIGICIMLFSLITSPCLATIAVTKQETNSWSWAMFQLAGLTILAWVVTTIVYQVGALLGLGVA